MKLVNFISLALCALISKLPMSPFKELMSGMDEIPFLGFINYFIPFDFAVTALSVWAPCMLAWRSYRLVKRIIMDIVSGVVS